MELFDLIGRFPSMKKRFMRFFYDFMLKRDADGDFVFMNYGYADPEGHVVDLRGFGEEYRYPIQLYHHVASGADLRGKDVLEVGSGCGGGALYAARAFRPRSYAGIDQSRRAVEFCLKNHSHEGLSFAEGDAERIPFGQDSFDAVLNIESSHCYGDVGKFFAEVYRVLRADGRFLFADFCSPPRLAELRTLLGQTGFAAVGDEVITAAVLRALDLEDARKLKSIREKAPRVYRGVLTSIVATKGSPTYEKFDSGAWEYFFLNLRKTGAGV